jgi:hypothetical protein
MYGVCHVARRGTLLLDIELQSINRYLPGAGLGTGCLGSGIVHYPCIKFFEPLPRFFAQLFIN